MSSFLSQSALKVYQSPQKNLWTGRSDGDRHERFHECILRINLQNDKLNSLNVPTFVLIGFASDEGIRRNLGRIGAREGPSAFRKALANLVMPPHIVVYDAGDVLCQEGDLEEALGGISEVVSLIMRHGMIPIVIGGGHELAFGSYLGMNALFPSSDCLFVNWDAHLDLRDPLVDNAEDEDKKRLKSHGTTSGSSFWQIAQDRIKRGLPFDYLCLGLQESANTAMLMERAHSLKARVMMSDEFHLGDSEKALDLISHASTHCDRIYLSLCLDVFAQAFAPGVSAPQPLGITPWQLLPGWRALAASGKVSIVTIAELCPPLDRDHATAKLAAALVADFLRRISCPP